MSGQKKKGMLYRIFASVWRRKFLFLFTALIVAAVVALISVGESQQEAASYVMLDFESAHNGLSPNGTRFNIYELKNEALMTNALALTGLSDAMTWRELAGCLTISPSRTQSVTKRYIATEYKATLRRTKDFGAVSARSMLDVICRLYYEAFLSQSGINHAQLAVDWSLLDTMEYAEIGEYIKSRTAILRQFLQNRIDESAGYESEDPSMSFRALLTTVRTFEKVYIDKYTAMITQSHLYKNPDYYGVKLTYQRMLIDQDYQLSRAQYSIREKALQAYQESLIAIVMVPTYYAGNGLYMSRTQTGIDTLTNAAESYSGISQKQALKLAKVDASILALSQAQDASTEQADALIGDISRQFDALIDTVKSADAAYISYTARDYVRFQPITPTLMDAYGVKDAAIVACAYVMVLAMLCFVLDTRKKKRADVTPGEERAPQ